MNDEDKTKEQLIQELARLRQRIAELECQETKRKRAEEALRISGKKYHAIFEQAANSVVLVDMETLEIVDFNERAYQNLGYTREEFANFRIHDIDPFVASTGAEPRVRRLHEGETHVFETQHRTKSGEIRDISVSNRGFHIGGKLLAMSIWHDITERKRTEEALENSERKYRELADFLPQTVFELDKSGNFTFANRHGFQSSGYTPEDIKREWNALQLFIPEDRTRVKKNIRMVLSGRKSKANEYTALRKDGSTYPVIVYSAPVIHEGKPAGLRGVVLDITERKRLENELQKSSEQLRNLTAHLQSVREEERADIARGVHDELGQALTALKMDLSWLSKRLPKEQESLLEKTEVMSGLINSAIQTVKKISTELRPGILDDFGLIAAIEWQAEEFHKRSGIKCTVSSVTEPQLDREHNTALFRIFQETLTNVARHTSATRVTVNLKVQGGNMIMRIRDNGKGITPEQLSSSSSFGIIGMRERARTLRGEITIRGIPGKGTTVIVTIPLVKNGESQ